jgi:hypothetical protein
VLASEMSNFLKSVRAAHPNNKDFGEVEAIEWAVKNVPQVKNFTWFGELPGAAGVFYADSYESRWFPRASPDEAADILAKEMY